jgi:signal transduction histidine kinase/CheY-like chemotaxis protein/HPt (histidine-containing phosphotransfer) domain-containing protein
LSIRARLLLLLLFATLMPALLGGMRFLERRDAEIGAARRDLAASAQRVARVLRDTVRATAHLHYGLSRASDLDAQEKSACSAFLADVLKEYPQYTGILTIKPDGELYCDSLRTGKQLNLTDRRYFQDALKARNTVAVEPAFGRLTGSAVLQIAYAVRAENGELEFVLLASLDLEKFMQASAEFLPRETAVIALMDDRGTILTWHPRGEKLRGTSIAGSPLFLFARDHRGAEAGELTEVSGVSRIWATSALPDFPEAGLHVLVGVTKKDLLAAANRNLGQSLAILGVVWLLAFAGAWALVEWGIRRHAARIIKGVARFSGGDFGTRIGKPYPRGEIGDLMAALDQAFDSTQTAHRRVVDDAKVLARTNRALEVLTEVDQALVRATDEATLLRDLCRIVIEFGGYLRCWVGYAEQDEAKSIRPVAQAGYEDGYLEALDLTWADGERGRGQMGRAIRGGAPAQQRYGPTDSDSAACRERAVAEGYAASIALPIKSGGQILGALVICAAEPDRFDDQEVGLLVELAADLGYGIDALRNRVELEKHRHRLEELVAQRTAKLEDANRAKNTFLATMSHEIRTPMNGVLGMLELLSLTRLDAEQCATLEIVRDSGKSLLRIIDDILDFSKIEAGKLEIRPEVTSIRDLIESVYDIYSGSARSKGLSMRRSVDPRIRPAVLVDSTRLRQILNNFVSNAVKFTSRGHVEITAELIERTDNEDRVRFAVEDSGIGISPETQARLFQPFIQAEGETTRRSGGTGLGLTICKRLAGMMGGSIGMASELGKGTTMTFTLSLPVAGAKDLPKTGAESTRDLLDATVAMRGTAPSVEQARAEGTLVLLVDDHPINRLLLARQIRVLGYAAQSAASGVEALEQWKSGSFALVVTDCNMPEMDGYSLARAIREIEADEGRRRTPIVACTANVLAGEAQACFAAGMDDYLAKPVELTQLLKKLEQWLPIPPAAAALPGDSGNSSHAPSSSADAPVDRSVLDEISGGDVAAERHILREFRRFNDEDAAMLQRAVADSDIAQVTHEAHRIKGASRTVGAMGLASVCERLEHAGRANDWGEIAVHMAAFHRELECVNAYFDVLEACQ